MKPPEPITHDFPGSISSQVDDSAQVDIMLHECHPLDYSPTLDLQIVTGQAVINICEISPDDIARLGEWMTRIARSVR